MLEIPGLRRLTGPLGFSLIVVDMRLHSDAPAPALFDLVVKGETLLATVSFGIPHTVRECRDAHGFGLVSVCVCVRARLCPTGPYGSSLLCGHMGARSGPRRGIRPGDQPGSRADVTASDAGGAKASAAAAAV